MPLMFPGKDFPAIICYKSIIPVALLLSRRSCDNARSLACISTLLIIDSQSDTPPSTLVGLLLLPCINISPQFKRKCRGSQARASISITFPARYNVCFLVRRAPLHTRLQNQSRHGKLKEKMSCKRDEMTSFLERKTSSCWKLVSGVRSCKSVLWRGVCRLELHCALFRRFWKIETANCQCQQFGLGLVLLTRRRFVREDIEGKVEDFVNIDLTLEGQLADFPMENAE